MTLNQNQRDLLDDIASGAAMGMGETQEAVRAALDEIDRLAAERAEVPADIRAALGIDDERENARAESREWQDRFAMNGDGEWVPDVTGERLDAAFDELHRERHREIDGSAP